MTQLPIPTADASAHGQKVSNHIASIIQQQGPISFAIYMQLALYAPGLGYYSAGAHKFGGTGDFVTAPELSPLFSQCLARQCQQVLEHLGGGDILEFGAGSGVMAMDILLECQRLGCLPEHYYIIEVSADLRERQQILLQEKIPDLFDRIIWLDNLPEKPINGVILANEVLDAMPVEIFKQANGLKQFYVDYQDEKFVWKLQDIKDTRLKSAVEKLEINFIENYQSEINLNIPPWITALSNSLQRGVVLLIDYGFPRHEYYHADRHMGTLMCHYQHHAHPDPLVYPGLQDITAHVDFTAVAEAAVSAGFDIEGFTHQAAFLLNCGIESNDLQSTQALKRLLLPSEMGELFKVIALSKGNAPDLIGFQKMDQLHRL
ncbi:MAG: SAM-dependent methyltransferase [Gammaproteobacteria bacterium]|nr:SAM-dependent methyltransferase [Gammaproteobacteria bacterium]MCH9744331.1 SAM-dependent methyltransferase [Gammaproteobacteria bacterium]